MQDDKMLPIKDFIERFGISYTVGGIAYHMKRDYIDHKQIARVRFVVLSKRTKTFYKII